MLAMVDERLCVSVFISQQKKKSYNVCPQTTAKQRELRNQQAASVQRQRLIEGALTEATFRLPPSDHRHPTEACRSTMDPCPPDTTTFFFYCVSPPDTTTFFFYCVSPPDSCCQHFVIMNEEHWWWWWSAVFELPLCSSFMVVMVIHDVSTQPAADWATDRRLVGPTGEMQLS